MKIKKYNTLFDYGINIDNNIIDVHTVLSLISNGININKDYHINYNNDIYFTEYENSKTLRLDFILEKLFNKIKNKKYCPKINPNSNEKCFYSIWKRYTK